MRFDELNEDNYLLFAIKFYNNPHALTKDDFEDAVINLSEDEKCAYDRFQQMSVWGPLGLNWDVIDDGPIKEHIDKAVSHSPPEDLNYPDANFELWNFDPNSEIYENDSSSNFFENDPYLSTFLNNELAEGRVASY